MSARDELADILHGKGAYCGSCGYEDGRCSDCKEVLTGYADAILAAGYRRPRTITTAEELDALGHGSVIRSEHRHYWVAHKEDGMGADQGWAAAGGSALTSRDLTSWLPATVLYEGGSL